MKLLTVILAICVLANGQSRRSLHLFNDETAILEPCKLLDNQYFDLSLNSSENAQVLQSATATPLSETEIEGEWHFGPTLSVQEELFISVVTADTLQVWSAVGLELQKLWEIEGHVHSLTRVSIDEFAGFVFVRSSQLCALDLRIRPITLQCFAGLEINEPSRVVVCQRLNIAATVQSHSGNMLIQEYVLDFQQMAVTTLTPLQFDFESEEVLDGICTFSFFFLQAHKVLIINDSETHLLQLPSLSYSSTKAIPNSEDIYVVSESSVAVVKSRKVLVLPDTIQVLALTQHLVYVTTHRSVYVREQADLQMSETRKLLVETANGEYEWAQSTDLDVLLVKEGSSLRLYLVEIDPVLVAVSGRGAPCTVEVCCHTRANCVAIAVQLATNNAETIIWKHPSDSGAITISQPLEGLYSSFSLDFSEYISGVNLRTTFALTQIPPEFVVSITAPSGNYSEETLLEFPSKMDKKEFLCVSFISPIPQVVLRVDGSIITFPSMSYALNIMLDHIVCEFCGDDLFIYGEAEGRMWLYRQRKFTTEQKELRKTDDVLLAMASTPAHLALLFSSRIDILHVAIDKWQTMETASEFIGVCSYKGTLVLLAHDTIEFLVAIGGLHISRAKVAVSNEVNKCAYSGDTLVLLNGSDILTVYYVSSSFELLARYSLTSNCKVTDIAISKHYWLYRCLDYFQVLNLLHTKDTSKIMKMPLLQNVAFLKMDDRVVFQVILSEKKLILHKSEPFINQNLHYEVTVRIPDGSRLSMPLELSGVLNVSSNTGTAREFDVCILLKNYGAVLSRPKLSNEVKVQWELTFTPSHYFRGHNLHFSASASDPTAIVIVQQTVTPVCSLPIAAAQGITAVSIQHSLVFIFHNRNLAVNKYVCEGEMCRVISRHFLTLDFPIILRLEIVLNTDRDVYLLIFGKYLINEYHCENVMALYRLDPQSMKLSILLNKKYKTIEKFHTIKASDTLYHLIIYGDELHHCKLSIPAAVSCIIVLHSSLYGVVTLGSHQLSNGHWEVYAITDSCKFLTMDLTDSLSNIAESPEFVTIAESQASFNIIGRLLIMFTHQSLVIYSIPTLTLINAIPYISKSFRTNIDTWITVSMGITLIAIREIDLFSILLDINSGFIVKKAKGVFFPIESSDTVVYRYNQSLTFLRLSPGQVTVKQGRQSSTDLVVTASNELSEGSVQVRIVWKDGWWPAILIVGAVLCASLHRRKPTSRNAEVEMSTVNKA